MATSKGTVICEIRECPTEEKVMDRYHKYVAEIDEEAQKIPERDKNKEARLKNFAKDVIEITKESSRRVSTPEIRMFLANTAKQLGDKWGLDMGIIFLEPYEEELQGTREWREEDRKTFEPYIRSVCMAITEVANERVDRMFTVYDLYRRAPEASFLFEPFLKQLENMGLLEFQCVAFEKLGKKGELQLIHVKDNWFSEKDIAGKIMEELAKKGTIPYSVLHTGSRNHYVAMGQRRIP